MLESLFSDIKFENINIRVKASEEEKLKDLKRLCNIKITKSIIYPQYKDYPTREIHHVTIKRGKSKERFKLILNGKTKKIIDVQTKYDLYCSTSKQFEILLTKIYFSEDKTIKDKADIINCKSGNCPICNSKIKKSINFIEKMVCPNGCYKLRRSLLYDTIVGVDVEFFGKMQKYREFKEHYVGFKYKIYQIEQIYSTISYWREEDRYLIKMLS